MEPEDQRITATLLMWPVLEKPIGDDGKKKWVRSKAPSAERIGEFQGFVAPTRVSLYVKEFCDELIVSIETGRAIQHPDWVLRPDGVAQFKKIQREIRVAVREFWTTELKRLPIWVEPPKDEEGSDDGEALADAMRESVAANDG